MDYFGLTLLITIVSTSTLLGFWVILSSRKSRINQLFFLIAISVLLWNIFGFLANNSNSETASLLFYKINYAAVALFLTIFYFFAVYFPIKSTKTYKTANYFVLSSGLILTVVSTFTDLIAKKVEFTGTSTTLTSGPFGVVFYAFSIIITIASLITLFSKYKRLEKENKSQVIYFFIGILFFAVFNIIFNVLIFFLFPNNSKITQYGDFSAIFLLGFSAYAIMKHQLFNIKLIATESVVILLSLILFIQIFISNSFTEGSINAIIWILATYGGYQLVKSVRVEIKQREQLAELAQKLEKANDHLKEVDKLKDDFLSMASHELNTPIAAIQGYLSMILVEKMAGVIPSKAKQYLQSVFTSSQRLAHMVKDLLNVSRIESNRIHLIYEEKQIEDIVEQAVTEVMSKAREANHALTFEKPKTKMPKTWLDTTRITEILINMLGNAIKYTDPGGKITVRVMHDEDKIVASVEDNGRGIPKDKQTSVFEKFSQVDVLKDQVKGTGLGMYISKKFIELHKGKIWFHSEGEGKGTTFFFSLPIVTKKPYDPHEGEDAVLH